MEVGQGRKYLAMYKRGRKQQRVLGESVEGGIWCAVCEWFDLESEDWNVEHSRNCQ